jgi:predicted cobalt transporter CbtA
LATVQLTKKKMAYVALVWVLLVICLMVYTMQQVNNTPLVPNDFNRSYTVARVVIGLVFFLGIVYIGARFIRSCMAP